MGTMWAHHLTTTAYILLVIEHAKNGDFCFDKDDRNIYRFRCTTITYQLALVGQVVAFVLTVNELSGSKRHNIMFHGPGVVLIILDYAFNRIGWNFRNQFAHLCLIFLYVIMSILVGISKPVNKQLNYKDKPKETWVYAFFLAGIWNVFFVIFALIHECKVTCCAVA